MPTLCYGGALRCPVIAADRMLTLCAIPILARCFATCYNFDRPTILPLMDSNPPPNMKTILIDRVGFCVCVCPSW